MAYHPCVYYGYGVCVNGIDTTDNRLKKLIEKAPALRKDIESQLHNADVSWEDATKDDIFATIRNGAFSLAYTLSDIIACTIQECENITLNTYDNYDSQRYLLHTPAYPWVMTDEEKALTEEKLSTIIRDYIGILTDKPIETKNYTVVNYV